MCPKSPKPTGSLMPGQEDRRGVGGHRACETTQTATSRPAEIASAPANQGPSTGPGSRSQRSNVERLDRSPAAMT